MISLSQNFINRKIHFPVGCNGVDNLTVIGHVDTVRLANGKLKVFRTRNSIRLSRHQYLAQIQLFVVFDLNPGIFFNLNDQPFLFSGRLYFCRLLFRSG